MKRWIAATSIFVVMLIGMLQAVTMHALAASPGIAVLGQSKQPHSQVPGRSTVTHAAAVPYSQDAATANLQHTKSNLSSSSTNEIWPARFPSLDPSGTSWLAASRIHSPSVLMDNKTPHQVGITLAGNSQFQLTEKIVLSGLLKDLSSGTPIPNKTVTFTTNGNTLGQARTDDQGGFQIDIHNDLPAGNYVVTAAFKGAHLLNPASGLIAFTILPATVSVQTVPATPGIPFQMAGQTFVSGADGTASVSINQSGVYRLDALVDQYNNPSQRVEFGRWSVKSYQPSREVQVPTDNVIQVGLNIYHKVNFTFVDLDNYPVDLSRISSISIRSVQGDIFNLKPGDTPWLPASRTARRQNGLQETDLLYSVNSVVIDGSNVVNSSQQRFYAKLDDNWTISLLLYTLKISTRDALFASPVGKSVSLTYPNGQVTNFNLDNAGNLTIHTLARGIYHVSLQGIRGMGTSTPVALSRNQLVNMRIITPLDAGVGGLTAFGLALGLIFIGRPWLLGNIVRKKRSAVHKTMDVRT